MDYLKRARELSDELIEIRRHLHQNPEVGFDLPNTVSFVKEELAEYGIKAEDIGDNGVTATFGKAGGKTILLRADMDALPMEEKSGEEFAATNGYMHACGHDIHTTSLLGAAKMLKENEANLKGQIKLIFQPAEELLIGAKNMVDAGILENPKVDFAAGLHVDPTLPVSSIATVQGSFMSSANNFRIKIKGVGSHGSMPYAGVDPVFIGAKIVTGVPVIIARELPFNESAVITMGKFIGDGAVNVVPDEVIIEGTARTHTDSTRQYIKDRLPELVQEIAQTYRGEAEFEFLSDCPPLGNNSTDFEREKGYLEELVAGEYPVLETPPVMASEDFAYYSAEVPSHFWNLGCPHPDLEENHPVHHPQARFDEEMIPVGAASLAHFATSWLEDNQ